jgi:hypothetical protein
MQPRQLHVASVVQRLGWERPYVPCALWQLLTGGECSCAAAGGTQADGTCSLRSLGSCIAVLGLCGSGTGGAPAQSGSSKLHDGAQSGSSRLHRRSRWQHQSRRDTQRALPQPACAFHRSAGAWRSWSRRACAAQQQQTSPLGRMGRHAVAQQPAALKQEGCVACRLRRCAHCSARALRRVKGRACAVDVARQQRMLVCMQWHSNWRSASSSDMQQLALLECAHMRGCACVWPVGVRNQQGESARTWGCTGTGSCWHGCVVCAVLSCLLCMWDFVTVLALHVEYGLLVISWCAWGHVVVSCVLEQSSLHGHIQHKGLQENHGRVSDINGILISGFSCSTVFQDAEPTSACRRSDRTGCTQGQHTEEGSALELRQCV